MNDLHITIRNRAGSVEHYYHFLLGFLLPLAIRTYALLQEEFAGEVLIRSCGPMDRILRELEFPGLTILPPLQHSAMGHNGNQVGEKIQRESLRGFDFTDGKYPFREIARAAAVVKGYLANKVTSHLQRQTPNVSERNRRILLVKRSIDPYYGTAQSERKTSGLQRRSIRNFDEMRQALESSFGPVNAVMLEQMDLAEQVALFMSAETIIAQHGAALANIIWCVPGTRVFEIAPNGYRERCFLALSRMNSLKHARIAQENAHGDADITHLIDAIHKTVI